MRYLSGPPVSSAAALLSSTFAAAVEIGRPAVITGASRTAPGTFIQRAAPSVLRRRFGIPARDGTSGQSVCCQDTKVSCQPGNAGNTLNQGLGPQRHCCQASEDVAHPGNQQANPRPGHQGTDSCGATQRDEAESSADGGHSGALGDKRGRLGNQFRVCVVHTGCVSPCRPSRAAVPSRSDPPPMSR